MTQHENIDHIHALIEAIRNLRHEIKEVRELMVAQSADIDSLKLDAVSLREWVDRIENEVYGIED